MISCLRCFPRRMSPVELHHNNNKPYPLGPRLDSCHKACHKFYRTSGFITHSLTHVAKDGTAHI